METFFKIYIACWASACLLALAAFVRQPSKFRIWQRAYRHFLKRV